jgi:hypothetical protein
MLADARVWIAKNFRGGGGSWSNVSPHQIPGGVIVLADLPVIRGIAAAVDTVFWTEPTVWDQMLPEGRHVECYKRFSISTIMIIRCGAYYHDPKEEHI